MAVVRLLYYLFWSAVFVVLLLFAIQNAEPVTLHFYFGQAWDAPLVFVVLASFAAGAVVGAAACVAPLLRQRRAVLALRRELERRAPQQAPAPAVPDLPSFQ